MSGDLSEFGPHFIVGLSGPTLSDLDRRILSTLRPAGILLLKRNFAWTAPTATEISAPVESNAYGPDTYARWLAPYEALISETRRLIGRSKVLITIDHEGGPVQTAPLPITNFGSAMRHRGKIEAVAQAMAVELASLGVNLSWAPVVDINSNKKNPIIGQLGRAYGESADEVSRYAVALNDILRNSGMLTCAKHYPGHGDTWSDSHVELPVVDASLATLRERELAPYVQMIAHRVPAIMTAHVMYPQIDAENPATLSRLLLHDLLRDELGFKGAVIADCINMRAIADRFAVAGGMRDAVNAGIDMFIVSRQPDAAEDDSPIVAARRLADAVRRGAVSAARIADARTAAERLIDQSVQYGVNALSREVLERHRTLRNSL